ncbi:hypothetical protein NW766_000807 [Fusarium irregulare]|uniref:Uncharacterized protein n=1 Tax=Fusarium irregulare TaxID=2494466 RepID=A0A9W8Q0U1_9HYPO|nr:hypothetical protein NW766_000807 [Fusarium irregulare]
MSQQDSSSDGSVSTSHSHSQSEDPPVWSTSEFEDSSNWVMAPDCPRLGHLEAILSTSELVSEACVRYDETGWWVRNSNGHGPKYDICFKLPCPGNNWIARLAVGSDSWPELLKLVKANEPKGVKYKYHRYETTTYGETITESLIFESFLEGEEREQVPRGPEMVLTLQERLGFDVAMMWT